MPITFDPDTERRLEAIARVRQCDPSEVVRSLLDELEEAENLPSQDILPFDEFREAMSGRFGGFESVPESEFLMQINRGFPEHFWQRYTFSRQALEDETFDEADRPELLRLIARRESAHVERIKYVSELARRRGTSLGALWRQFGLGHP